MVQEDQEATSHLFLWLSLHMMRGNSGMLVSRNPKDGKIGPEVDVRGVFQDGTLEGVEIVQRT